MKGVSLLVSSLLAVLMVSCTGDPTRGGIFWSKSKADERRAALIAQREARQAELSALETANAEHASQISRLKSQIAAKKAELRRRQAAAAAAAAASSSSNEAECRRLKAEISQLEAEIKAAEHAMR